MNNFFKDILLKIFEYFNELEYYFYSIVICKEWNYLINNNNCHSFLDFNILKFKIKKEVLQQCISIAENVEYHFREPLKCYLQSNVIDKLFNELLYYISFFTINYCKQKKETVNHFTIKNIINNLFNCFSCFNNNEHNNNFELLLQNQSDHYNIVDNYNNDLKKQLTQINCFIFGMKECGKTNFLRSFDYQRIFIGPNPLESANTPIIFTKSILIIPPSHYNDNYKNGVIDNVYKNEEIYFQLTCYDDFEFNNKNRTKHYKKDFNNIFNYNEQCNDYGTNYFIYCFDISNKESFYFITKKLQKEIKDVKNCKVKCERILIGLKKDLERNVNVNEINELCELYKIPYIEVSSKTFDSINVPFLYIVLINCLLSKIICNN
ncbi:hypothetical protein ABK040_005004 [Willaertia magna]